MRGKLTLLANTHVIQPLVPAADDLPGTERELEGPATLARAVELGPVQEPAVVVLRSQKVSGRVGRQGGR